MDDLAKARAELALLEEQERQLLEHLRNVRSAVQGQKNRIDELLKHAVKPSISRLPVTALYQIIYLAVNDRVSLGYAHRSTKRKLASVSRRWRDVILTSPSLWTTIIIHPSWSASLVIAHVRRSRECPLDIQISSWHSRDDLPKFSRLLGLVISCGYRWRSLVIRHNDKNLEDSIFRKLWDVMFPSLKCVTISATQKFSYPPFLDLQHAHTLEHLDLGETINLDNFSAAASLKTLRLQCSSLGVPLKLPSITSLRTLTMSGSNCGTLLPDSIHLPLLESLTVVLEYPKSFLAAIVTPRLGHFTYSPSTLIISWSEIFEDLRGKFPNVQHLRLQYTQSSFDVADAEDAAAVYAAFPGVHHLEMDMSDFVGFCLAEREDSPLTTADHWTRLEQLSLGYLTHADPDDRFVKWLRARKLEGRPAPQVTLSNFHTQAEVLTVPWLISLYNSLHEYCLLELKDVPLTFNLTVRRSDLDVHGSPPIMDMVEGAIRTELVCASTGMAD